VRFGLFGTGHWARVTHGAALAAHPTAELVGVWGRDPVKAAALADEYAARPYADVDTLLADVDAVAIALPPDVQPPIAIRAAEAGRHLLLDKPVALSVADADSVVAAVERADVAAIVFFTGRFVPSVADFLRDAAVRGEAATGWDGCQSTMRGSIFQPGSPYGSSTWRRLRGGLWDVGPHALAMALPLLGPAEDVVAMAGLHDIVHVMVRHASGAVTRLELTVAAPPGSVRFETVFSGPDGPAAVPSYDIAPVAAFGIAIDQLLGLVARGERQHPCDVRFAREVVAVLERAEASIR
jgi:predicted dehydrogenase